MPSALSSAGRVLLLVGAIVSLALAVVVAGMGFLGGRVVFLVVAGIFAAGAASGFVAWRQAVAGRSGRAFGFGLAAGLLPPVQVFPLVGAILVKVAAEQATPATPTNAAA